MNKMCHKWSKTIHLDGYVAKRKELWVASLLAVAVAFIWTVGEMQFPLPGYRSIIYMAKDATIYMAKASHYSMAKDSLSANLVFIIFYSGTKRFSSKFASSLGLCIIATIMSCFHIRQPMIMK